MPTPHAEADSAIDALPSMNAEPAPPTPTPEPAPAPAVAAAAAKPEPAAAKPAAAAPVDPMDDLPKVPEPTPAPAAAPVVAPPQKIAEVRVAYESQKKELETLRTEKAEWEKKIETTRKTAAEETSTKLAKDIAALRQERQELADQLRFIDYRESPEYKEKFQKPLQSRWEEAISDIEGLTVTNEDGTTEPVTAAHLTRLLGMPAGQAASEAARLFGPAATEVLAHRRAILGLQKAAASATEEWKTKGSQLSADRERQQSEHHAAVRGQYDNAIKGMRESVPDIFARPTDDEAAKFFDKGEELVNLAFKREGLEDGLTPEQQTQRIVRAQAGVAARAAAFGAQQHRLNKANARVKALETELAAYKSTEPDPSTKPPTPAAVSDRPEDAIDALPNI